MSLNVWDGEQRMVEFVITSLPEEGADRPTRMAQVLDGGAPAKSSFGAPP